MLLITTLDAWRAEPDAPFRSETAAYTPEEDAVALANDAFGAEQIIALVFDHPALRLPGAVSRDTVREVRYARRGPDGRVTGFHVRPPTAAELDLLPHPEGGWYRETWRTPARTPAHGGERPSATGTYFLLAPGEESAWHVLRSDEMWLWHRGGPLELRLGGTGETPSAATEDIGVGPDIERGERPQALVPAGTWQSAHPTSTRETLVTCVVAPGADPTDLRIAQD